MLTPTVDFCMQGLTLTFLLVSCSGSFAFSSTFLSSFPIHQLIPSNS